MRIRHVIARAFGPFQDETLQLGEGMTVVAGPNEAGKSSWHAATRLAITGMRRGRGRSTRDDAALAERHRPWDTGDRWEVEARLDLDDGRTIDIQQDLAGKVACRATDIGLGRDVSDEIMDGTPDASRWLGLDRDAFAATVSVNQADILAVADAADELQEQMQRAAATRGTDATAAQAIERLMEFRREAVGADTVAAKGPLRLARNRLVAAMDALAVARERHAAYLEQSAGAEEADLSAAAARRDLAAAVAAQARIRARRATERAARAAALAARHPAPPSPLTERDAAADRVAAAITGWERRPAPVSLSGPSSSELADELARLPSPPDGPLQPEAELRALGHELDRAEEALALLAEEPELAGTPVDAASVERMRATARRLSAPMPAGAETLEARLAAAREAANRETGGGTPRLALGALVALGGVLVAVLLSPLPGVILAVAGLALAGWGWRAEDGARGAARRLAEAEAALAPYREARMRADQDREAAAAEARRAGWPEDPQALEALADRVADAARGAERAEARRAQRAALETRREQASTALLAALGERGIHGHREARSAWTAYETACAERGRQAAESARAEPLRRTLAARESEERTAAGIQRSIDAAAAALRDAAIAAGMRVGPEVGSDRLVEGLRAWQRERAAAMGAGQAALSEWQELVSLLDGRSLDEVRSEAAERAGRAASLAAGLDDGELERLAMRADLEGLVSARRDRADQADRDANQRRGALEVLRTGLPDVAEAEERVAIAEAELERVNGLARTIDQTLLLLRSAQERVHRDLAPVLAQAVQRWLPVVSGGAYAEVTVDPANLMVRVKEARSGAWREARLLSAGTREQIYLLLRVAMAQHLVTTDETAPLLLDEVTAQADPERRAGLLRVLHELSRERQVILFSHDDAVAAWAERSLDPARDRLVRLPSRTAVAAAPASSGGSGGTVPPPPENVPAEPVAAATGG